MLYVSLIAKFFGIVPTEYHTGKHFISRLHCFKTAFSVFVNHKFSSKTNSLAPALITIPVAKNFFSVLKTTIRNNS